ncbi:hypothetical protein Tco_0335315 [Tanacetum coccineum]
MHEEASSFNIEESENIQATIKADEELAQRIQADEREKYSEAEKARLIAELINQRNRYFTQKIAEERRNKPLTQAQQRTHISNFIKHMGSHTLHQLKRLSFDELKDLFETTMRRVQTFHSIESDGEKTVPELTTRSSKRDAEVELDHEGSKKQKTNEASGYLHNPLVWRLYDTCGVHHVSSVRGHDIFMLVEKDYPLLKGVQMLMLANKLLVEQHSEMANELLRKICIQANRPRQ